MHVAAVVERMLPVSVLEDFLDCAKHPYTLDFRKLDQLPVDLESRRTPQESSRERGFQTPGPR